MGEADARGSAVAGSEADDVARLEATVGQLETALTSRLPIEAAKGVLAERYDLAVEDAYDLLRYAARTSRRNIHDVAAEVVCRPSAMPQPISVALARTMRWRAAGQRERAEAMRQRARRTRPLSNIREVIAQERDALTRLHDGRLVDVFAEIDQLTHAVERALLVFEEDAERYAN